jgi:hypothetical protein
VDVAALCAPIRDWTIAQIPDGAADLDQVVCDGKTLRGSIEPTAGGGSAFIAQVTLYSAALGVAISQACYATAENRESWVDTSWIVETTATGTREGKPFQAQHLY